MLTATIYNHGQEIESREFTYYAEARHWVIAQTGVKRTVCLANDTAEAAHEPGESPRWTIKPIIS